MPPELAPWISPAIIVGFMLYLNRRLESRMDRMEAQLRGDMRDFRSEMRDLRDRMESQNSDLRDRLGRIEGYLDLLREFFIGSGRGTAA